MTRFKLKHLMTQIRLENGFFDTEVEASNDSTYESDPPSQNDMMRCELHHSCHQNECKKLGCAATRYRENTKTSTPHDSKMYRRLQ